MSSIEIDSLAQYKTRALSMRRLLLGKAKLKASSRTSALLSGFAMVAMVEIELNSEMPKGILITFSIITTLVVALHLLALMISTCILPHLEAISEMQTLVLINDSPHDHFYWYIEIAWFLSTGLGIFLFLAQMAILVWVRFYKISEPAHIASTAIILPVIVIFIAFAIHFHRNLITVKCQHSTRGIVELERLAHDLESGQSGDDDRRNPYSSYDTHHLTNNNQHTPYAKNNQNTNLYNNNQFNYLSYPKKNQLIIQNGLDVVFQPINPLTTQRNTQNATKLSIDRNNCIDNKVNELLSDNQEFKEIFQNAKEDNSKVVNTATENESNSMQNTKNLSQNSKTESFKLINKNKNFAKSTPSNHKFFSKYFSNKTTNSSKILNL